MRFLLTIATLLSLSAVVTAKASVSASASASVIRGRWQAPAPWGILCRGGAAAAPDGDDDITASNDDDDDEDEPVTDTTTAPKKGRAASSIPKGGSESVYAIQLEVVKDQVLSAANSALEELRKTIVNEATIVPEFGKKADTIVNKALEDFAKAAPDATNRVDEADYEAKLVQLEATLDAPLQVLYLKELQLVRDDALQRFKAASKTSGASEYEAMLQADAYFVRMAEEATRVETTSEEWDFSSERAALQSVMNNLAASGKKAVEIQMQSAQQQQTAMQFLQQQQQMIQQLQMQLYGQTSPWNVGVAYRIPDTNFNLQGSYQQGRANFQLSCVPDEYAPFLGPNGFTNGVGPGNLGLSLNLSV